MIILISLVLATIIYYLILVFIDRKRIKKYTLNTLLHPIQDSDIFFEQEQKESPLNTSKESAMQENTSANNDEKKELKLDPDQQLLNNKSKLSLVKTDQEIILEQNLNEEVKESLEFLSGLNRPSINHQPN